MKSICKECGKDFVTNRSTREYCSRRCSNKHNARDRADEPIRDKKYKVWSSGGGVQSTAIAVLIEAGVLEKPDYGIMIDCGYEKTATLDYMHNVTIPRMEKIGVPFLMLNTLDYTNNNLTDGNGHVNIPAFRLKPNGIISKLHTHCNSTWKVRVTRLWAKQQGIKYMENWIGISTDEARRTKESPLKWITLRYPLMELDMSREGCVYAIANAGWPLPPRSSCVFCPQQDAAAWKAVRSTPEDWQRVLKAEQIIKREAPDVYLHRSCIPIEDCI